MAREFRLDERSNALLSRRREEKRNLVHELLHPLDELFLFLLRHRALLHALARVRVGGVSRELHLDGGDAKRRVHLERKFETFRVLGRGGTDVFGLKRLEIDDQGPLEAFDERVIGAVGRAEAKTVRELGDGVVRVWRFDAVGERRDDVVVRRARGGVDVAGPRSGVNIHGKRRQRRRERTSSL